MSRHARMVVTCGVCRQEARGPIQESPDGSATLTAREIADLDASIAHLPTCRKFKDAPPAKGSPR